MTVVDHHDVAVRRSTGKPVGEHPRIGSPKPGEIPKSPPPPDEGVVDSCESGEHPDTSPPGMRSKHRAGSVPSHSLDPVGHLSQEPGQVVG